MSSAYGKGLPVKPIYADKNLFSKSESKKNK